MHQGPVRSSTGGGLADPGGCPGRDRRKSLPVRLPADRWQQTWFEGEEPTFRRLGKLSGSGSIREAIDAQTKTVSRLAASGPSSKPYLAARTLTARVKESTGARADEWRAQIERLKGANPAANAFKAKTKAKGKKAK